MTDRKPSVLFVCVHNAGRSQMAAGWVRGLAGDRVEVRSAGSMPADQINPVAVEAMREVDIDITAEQPKVLTTEAVQGSDVVITMGCGDACPFFPGKRYEDWKLEDPAGQGIDVGAPDPRRDQGPHRNAVGGTPGLRRTARERGQELAGSLPRRAARGSAADGCHAELDELRRRGPAGPGCGLIVGRVEETGASAHARVGQSELHAFGRTTFDAEPLLSWDAFAAGTLPGLMNVTMDGPAFFSRAFTGDPVPSEPADPAAYGRIRLITSP